MTFPVEFHLFGRTLPAHPVMETIAYAVGSQLYYFLRRRKSPAQRIPFEQMMWLLVGCVFGALIGSKVLAWIESFPDYWAARSNPAVWMGGKTIVGGLLGGWVGVEIAKRCVGVTRSTGDVFVFPLILGIAIGRIGCFLTGLPDHTYGTFTSLPWGVNFGDGLRHPTQLYEILFLILLGTWLALRGRKAHREGDLFRRFLLGYLGFRLLIEFIKPTFKPWLGLSAIQVASLLGALWCARSLLRHDQGGLGIPPEQMPSSAGEV
jgi:prolipoprotein diacylglyceryltransferase